MNLEGWDIERFLRGKNINYSDSLYLCSIINLMTFNTVTVFHPRFLRSPFPRPTLHHSSKVLSEMLLLFWRRIRLDYRLYQAVCANLVKILLLSTVDLLRVQPARCPQALGEVLTPRNTVHQVSGQVHSKSAGAIPRVDHWLGILHRKGVEVELVSITAVLHVMQVVRGTIGVQTGGGVQI